MKKGTAEPVRVPIVSATTGPRNHDAAVFLNWDTDPWAMLTPTSSRCSAPRA
ncbi:hypothetical protein AHiyo1_50490 [Arthrobacter sp. Hiyo1]|nr:hypothetical protein AHiyo1_50490 [Arthrobacter sp. Hiyo1]